MTYFSFQIYKEIVPGVLYKLYLALTYLQKKNRIDNYSGFSSCGVKYVLHREAEK